jgi:hypothetical protein
MNGSSFAGIAKPHVTWFFITKRSRAVLVGGSLGPLAQHGRDRRNSSNTASTAAGI